MISRILDEALRESSSGPYLDMPDCVMNECIVGYGTDVGKTNCGLFAAYQFHIQHCHRERERYVATWFISLHYSMHRFP